ncbi:MAG: hypothetical protein D6692_10135 [Planctomycetota bacterium]|nr:MAG: hypothetical protein D6692_10135 [Planctomycetota bacterium]
MNAPRSRQTNIGIIVVSLVTIATSTIFLIRVLGSPSPQTDATPEIHLPTVRTGRALARSHVATDEGLADRMRALLVSQQAGALTDSQINLLADQSAAILRTRAGGAFEDYLDLMRSWGGRCDLTGADLDRLRQGWKPADHPLALADYDLDALSLEVSDTPPTVQISRGGPGLFTLTTASQFRFQNHWTDLLGGISTQAEITIPTRTNAGDVVEVSYAFFWSPSDNRWIPFRLTMMTRERLPLPLTIY